MVFSTFSSVHYLDTIYSSSTPYGYSGIAIIRVSGSSAMDLCVKSLGYKEVESRKMIRSALYDPTTKQVIDQVLFCFFKAPHSFTGEDVLEIHTHGNPLIIESIFEICDQIKNFRFANRGEFTQRALEKW